jgi:hypothetical protein
MDGTSGQPFSDPLDETVNDDQGTYWEGGYVSERTQELALICEVMLTLGFGSEPEETEAA